MICVFFYIDNNQIKTLNLTGAPLRNLDLLHVANNPLTKVDLTQTSLSDYSIYGIFSELSDLSYDNAIELDNIILNEVDFTYVDQFYTLAETIEHNANITISLQHAVNLQENLLLQLIKLDITTPMTTLNLTGTWYSLSDSTGLQFLDWNALEGHTLIIPEPTTAFLSFALACPFTFARRKRLDVPLKS